ncbi:hypothetical protein ACM01_43565 [Streptomyces viridochromogenes]|uniref:Uncharacterized protein n=1 Tax=Streptomyces viridochromogenes TaxID=1938 RepID=A0A0J7YUV9_STRVR|nr:hypothetical protein [Streptomyces viridochromogenes]KMS67242.1 hypothetical protein ACM01_43565 [Streptomyces viridochromogenes]KOG26345.1 hypothetical protein ADK36_03495 [Streptomyces viridochromogenes]KOG27984.1 hypothetical protein ADK35_04495 [Streptomyces viridochromogenes]
MEHTVVCCECGKPIPLSQDIYALDGEWQRRFPSMNGTLACHDCAVGTQWSCQRPGGSEYVDGHIAASGRSQMQDFDSWSHILGNGTHRAMVIKYPGAGLRQGAEEYLRDAAQRRGVAPALARELRAAISDWDSSTAPVRLNGVSHS